MNAEYKQLCEDLARALGQDVLVDGVVHWIKPGEAYVLPEPLLYADAAQVKACIEWAMSTGHSCEIHVMRDNYFDCIMEDTRPDGVFSSWQASTWEQALTRAVIAAAKAQKEQSDGE